MGRPPTLSPLSVDVILPCYESAWEAETADECLRRLQSSPAQLSISTALRTLRGGDSRDGPVLEASGYGMFVLINGKLNPDTNHFGGREAANWSSPGLHSFVFHLTREETVPLFSGNMYNPQPFANPVYSTSVATAMNRLRNDFSRSTVEAVADDLSKTHAAPAFQELTTALNAWRLSWDSRMFGDNQSDGQNFSGDPMPFWHLAKLFIALYLIGEGQTVGGEMRLPRARGGDSKGKQLNQERIVSWLQKLGADQSDRPEHTATAATGPSAADQDGSRLLLLMRPLSDI